jgi:hypothetical protein
MPVGLGRGSRAARDRLGGLPQEHGCRCAHIVKPIFEIFMWAPRLCAVAALVLFSVGAWNARRLHNDPVALYEGR